MWKHTDAPQVGFTGDEMVIQNYKGRNIVKREMSKKEAKDFLNWVGEDRYIVDEVINEGHALEIGNATKWMGNLTSFGEGTVARVKKNKLKEIV